MTAFPLKAEPVNIGRRANFGVLNSVENDRVGLFGLIVRFAFVRFGTIAYHEGSRVGDSERGGDPQVMMAEGSGVGRLDSVSEILHVDRGKAGMIEPDRRCTVDFRPSDRYLYRLAELQTRREHALERRLRELRPLQAASLSESRVGPSQDRRQTHQHHAASLEEHHDFSLVLVANTLTLMTPGGFSLGVDPSTFEIRKSLTNVQRKVTSPNERG